MAPCRVQGSWDRGSVLSCITYKPLHPASGRACKAHCSTHGDKIWALACNENENANRKPIMIYPSIFTFRGGEEGGIWNKFKRKGVFQLKAGKPVIQLCPRKAPYTPQKATIDICNRMALVLYFYKAEHLIRGSYLSIKALAVPICTIYYRYTRFHLI